MRARWLATVGWITAAGVAAGGAGCGDNIPGDDVLASVSGGRLALQVYGYEDGTRQVDPFELYDLHLHTTCTAQIWSDGWQRCVPEADDAVFTDAACTMLVGRSFHPQKPSVFIGYDVVDGATVPARLYRAVAVTTPPTTSFYQRVDGGCVGPFGGPFDVTYYSVGDEVPAAEIAPIYDDERGDGRIGIRIQTSDDGFRLVTGLHDQQLDAACAPALTDGGVVCAPTDPSPAPATLFHDPGCTAPVVAMFEVIPPQPVPAIAAVIEPSGCTTYRAVGAEVIAPVYRRAGDVCVPAAVSPGQRLYDASLPVDIATLDRSVDAAPGRRLQRVVLDDGVTRFLDDRLFDTALHADCKRVFVGDEFRCLPASLAPTITLFAPGCGVPVPVVELPAHACEPPRFALTAAIDGTLEVRAIGDPQVEPLYVPSFGACVPYTATPGTIVHALGPPIDPTAFVGATYYGER